MRGENHNSAEQTLKDPFLAVGRRAALNQTLVRKRTPVPSRLLFIRDADLGTVLDWLLFLVRVAWVFFGSQDALHCPRETFGQCQ